MVKIKAPALRRDKEYTAKKNRAHELGEQWAHDDVFNCLSCTRWSVCKDPSKSYQYRCSRFTENIVDQEYPEQSLADLFKISRDADKAAHDVGEIEEGSEQEQTLLDLIEKAVASNSPIPPDIKIKDEEIPRAKNFYEWMTDKRFAMTGQPPFPRQIYMGTMLFGEYCPRCSDVDWFETMKVNVKLSRMESRVTFLENGVCPHCKVNKMELVHNGEINDYFVMSGIIGQRSGKTSSAVLMEGYNQHKFLKLSSPTQVYGTLPQNMFMSTYTSTTFGQAKENVWTQYDSMLKNSPWFVNYHKFLDRRGQELGEELYVLSEIFARYRHRNYHVSPASPSQRTMRGRCVTGDTMVNTNHGFVAMRELINEQGYHNVNNLSIDGPRGQKAVSHTYKDKDFVYQITTRNGFEIKGTAEHPLLVFTPDLKFKWRSLDSLKEGDWLVSSTKMNKPTFGMSNITKDHAGWLGYWVANGVNDGRIYTKESSILTRVTRYAKRMLPGVRPVTKTDSNGVTSIYFTNSPKGKRMTPSFARQFIPKDTRGNSYDKSIPLSVRTAPKEVLHEFLEAYFECDCHINGGKFDSAGGVISPSVIILSSSSKKLMRQLHVILAHGYGIIGRFSSKYMTPEELYTCGKYYNRDVYEAHQISLTGSDAYRFLQVFKRAKVQKYADRFHPSRPGDHNDRRVIPYIRRAVCEAFAGAALKNKSGKKSRYLELVTGEQVLNYNRMKPMFLGREKRNTLGTLPEFSLYEDDWDLKLPWLRSISPSVADRVEYLLHYGAHFEEVVAIRKSKKPVTVYDVTVPDGHAFTANNLVSHNTRLSAMVDEISWMKSTLASGKEAEQGNAKETFTALRNSLDTVIGGYRKRFNEGYFDLPKPLIYAISSPSQVNDYGMVLNRSGHGSREIFSMKCATWDFNPLQPRENFDDRFRTNPTEAARDYACEPPIGTSTFLSDIGSIINSFGSHYNTFNVKQGRARSKSGKKVTRAVLKPAGANPNLRWGCVLTIDVGLTNNSFAFAVSTVPNDFELEDYLDGESDEDDATFSGVPLKTIFVGEVIPQDNAPLSLISIHRDVLAKLCEQYPIVALGTDRWQNVKIQQDIEDEFEVEPIEIRLKWDDFDNFRDALYEDEIDLPRMKMDEEALMSVMIEDYPNCFLNQPTEHLAYQMLTVQEQRGKTVVKGDATDDMFRCIVLAHTMVNDPEINELLIIDDYEDTVKRGPVAVLGRGNTGAKTATRSTSSGPLLAKVVRSGR